MNMDGGSLSRNFSLVVLAGMPSPHARATAALAGGAPLGLRASPCATAVHACELPCASYEIYAATDHLAHGVPSLPLLMQHSTSVCRATARRSNRRATLSPEPVTASPGEMVSLVRGGAGYQPVM